MRRSAAFLLVCALAAPRCPARGDEKPLARIETSEKVVRLLVDAYVTDGKGNPIPDLLPADFRVTADGKPLEVETAEFIPAGSSEGPKEPAPPAAAEAGPAPGAPASASPAPVYPPGRLLVFFLEGDISRWRTKGLIRVRAEIHRLLDRLRPTDRVAVVRFFSHLTVLCDFTNDRAVLEEALVRGLGSSKDRDVLVSPFPSLAANLDFPEARKAAHVERALELVAGALEPIPGAKAVLFVGWGFFANRAPIETALYARAMASLMRARANLFTLDTSDADWHTLETSLMVASEVTGGTYAKTHLFTGQAIDLVARALEGRYVLVCVATDAVPADLRVKLAGRRGTVVARAYTALR